MITEFEIQNVKSLDAIGFISIGKDRTYEVTVTIRVEKADDAEDAKSEVEEIKK